MKPSLVKYNKIGRPDLLTPDLTLKIKVLFLSGKNIKNIQVELGLNAKTWEGWYRGNFKGFRQFLCEMRQERMIALAQVNLIQFLSIPIITREVITLNGPQIVIDTDHRLLRLKLDATKYVSSKFDSRFKLDNNRLHI